MSKKLRVLLLSLFLVGCTTNENIEIGSAFEHSESVSEKQESVSSVNEKSDEKVLLESSEKNIEVLYVSQTAEIEEMTVIEAASSQVEQWDVADLENIIIQAGFFWSDWLGNPGEGRFPLDDFSSWENTPEHLREKGFRELLPSSQFENLNAIRNYLLQFYTQRWIDDIFMYMPLFMEYNNALYMNFDRIHSIPHSYWQTANHFLLELKEDRAVIMTSVIASPFLYMLPDLTFSSDRDVFFENLQKNILTSDEMPSSVQLEDIIEEVWYRITFTNGKIDTKSRLVGDDYVPWNVFGVYE